MLCVDRLKAIQHIFPAGFHIPWTIVTKEVTHPRAWVGLLFLFHINFSQTSGYQVSFISKILYIQKFKGAHCYCTRRSRTGRLIFPPSPWPFHFSLAEKYSGPALRVLFGSFGKGDILEIFPQCSGLCTLESFPGICTQKFIFQKRNRNLPLIRLNQLSQYLGRTTPCVSNTSLILGAARVVTSVFLL